MQLCSAALASSYFDATVYRKSPLHYLPSCVCQLCHNFKPVHGHSDFQRVTGGLRGCRYALHSSMFFKHFPRFSPQERQTSELQPSKPGAVGFVSLQPYRGTKHAVGGPGADAVAHHVATWLIWWDTPSVWFPYCCMRCLHQHSGKTLDYGFPSHLLTIPGKLQHKEVSSFLLSVHECATAGQQIIF